MKNNEAKPRNLQLITLLSLSHFFCHVAILTYPAILLLLKARFHVNYATLGLIAGIYLFFFGAGSLPTGFIADKIKKENILRIYLAGMAIFSFLAAISGNFYIFAFSAILIGLTASIYHPVGLSLMSMAAPDKLKGFAIHGIAGTMGVAISAAFAGILGYFAGYNFPYLVLGIIFSILFVLSFLLKGISKGIPVPGAAFNNKKTKRSVKSVFMEFLHKNLLLIFVAEFLNGFVFQGVFSFLPAYAGIELKNFLFFHNQAAAAGGFFVTVALMIGVFFQYNSIKITKNYKPNKTFTVLLLISGVFILISGFSGGIVLLLSILAFSAFNFSINPIANLMISENALEKNRASAYGIFFFFGFGIGSIAAPIGGIIAQKFALHWTFVAYGLVLLLAFLISIAIREGKYA